MWKINTKNVRYRSEKDREKEGELEYDLNPIVSLHNENECRDGLAKEDFAQQNGPEQILCLLLIIQSKEQGESNRSWMGANDQDAPRWEFDEEKKKSKKRSPLDHRSEITVSGLSRIE